MDRLFNSKRALYGLIILLIGILCASVISLFLFNYYWRLSRNNISVSQAKHKIISLSVMSRHLHHAALKSFIKTENHGWLHITLGNKPFPKIPIANNHRELQQQLNSQHQHIRLSLKLPKRGYLNINGHRPDKAWQYFGIGFSLLILMLVLILFCYWLIQYVSNPLRGLAKAVETFGYDIKAPPIAEQGSEEMRAVIRAFNNMQQQIRHLLDDRTQMLAAISHDLRTPITRLKLRAETISDTTLYEKILADLSDMEQMIASILTYAREQHNDEAMQKFDLSALLDSICADKAAQGEQVGYQANCNKLVYYGRLLSLKRSFNNLIENAIKYGEACTVTLNTTKQGINIEIADRGPGIADSQMKKVFQPFYRINSARTLNIPGSGLGLSIAKAVIESLGGTINLHNRDSGGLSIIIVLPHDEKL